MDEERDPAEYKDEIEPGISIVDDYKDGESEALSHTPLPESVKEDRSKYAISQAFQVGLPGVNT